MSVLGQSPMIKTVALPVRPVVEVDLEFWVRDFDSVAMDVESYAVTFCHRLCSNCVRMSYLSPFACRSRNGNSKVAMDIFQRQLLILAKQPYRVCKFSVHVLLRITATITEWPPKWFLKLSAADRPLRCMVLFWLFFVLVLVLVLVLDRASEQLYHSILVNALIGQEFGDG
jgi:hypothetical protein